MIVCLQKNVQLHQVQGASMPTLVTVCAKPFWKTKIELRPNNKFGNYYPRIYRTMNNSKSMCYGKALTLQSIMLGPVERQFSRHIAKIKVLTWHTRKEGNVLFNNALNTFYLRLYGVGHIIKNHSDCESGNPMPPHGILLPISSKGTQTE